MNIPEFSKLVRQHPKCDQIMSGVNGDDIITVALAKIFKNVDFPEPLGSDLMDDVLGRLWTHIQKTLY